MEHYCEGSRVCVGKFSESPGYGYRGLVGDMIGHICPAGIPHVIDIAIAAIDIAAASDFYENCIKLYHVFAQAKRETSGSDYGGYAFDCRRELMRLLRYALPQSILQAPG